MLLYNVLSKATHEAEDWSRCSTLWGLSCHDIGAMLCLRWVRLSVSCAVLTAMQEFAQVWDLGGQANLRPSWATYYQHTDCVILVSSSSGLAVMMRRMSGVLLGATSEPASGAILLRAAHGFVTNVIPASATAGGGQHGSGTGGHRQEGAGNPAR